MIPNCKKVSIVSFFTLTFVDQNQNLKYIKVVLLMVPVPRLFQNTTEIGGMKLEICLKEELDTDQLLLDKKFTLLVEWELSKFLKIKLNLNLLF